MVTASLSQSKKFRSLAATLTTTLAAALLTGGAAPTFAQTPVALPYTMTTLAGTSPMSATAGTQCPNLPTGKVSTDAFGDGCLAVNGIFGASSRGGVATDAFGNIFIDDDVNGIIHVINPTTGIMTALAGKGTVCATPAKLDAPGDGCIAATQTLTAGQRGIGVDYWGNVLLGGYSDNLVHIICRAASPNCTAAQVGTMQLVAGCSSGSGSNGSGGLGLSNTVAKSTLVACTTSLGEVGAPRGAWGDKFGNIFYADTNNSRFRVVLGPQTSTYFTGNNPLYTVLLTNNFYTSLTAGYVYSIINTTPNCATAVYTDGPSPTAFCGGTPTTVGQSCGTATALDTIGDGCPFQYSSLYASSGYEGGIVTDAAGNIIFPDATEGLRVLFVSSAGTAGAAMANAIQVNNPTVTPTPGYVYMLAGNVHGSTTGTLVSTTPTLGTATQPLDSAVTKLWIGPDGNIYIGDSTRVLFFDITTGYIRVLFTASSNKTAGAYCSGTTGQKSLTAYSDACAASQSIFSNSNGLGLSTDTQGNLYLFDSASNTSGMLVRKVLAQDLVPGTVGTQQIQNFQEHFYSTAGALGTPYAVTTYNPDLSAAAPTCTTNADSTVDCNTVVTATPSAPGLRSATLTTVVASTSSQPANISLQEVATGSALAVDSATSNGTAISAATTTLISGVSPVGVAVDGAGNVYTMDKISNHFLESINGTVSALPGTLPTTPSSIAVDPTGNVFAVGSGTPTVTELAVANGAAGSTSPAGFNQTSVTYTPTSGTAAPIAVATDIAGDIYVADKQATAANTGIYRISLSSVNNGTPQYTVATGFTTPSSIAVDPSGNVYVADTGTSAVYKLTPLTTGIPGYTQTTVTLPGGALPVQVATDAAGDLYVQDNSTHSVIEIPVTGAATTVATGLTTPSGVAVDNSGNVYSGDSSADLISKTVRSVATFSFGTGSSGSPTYAATITDIGNQASTGQPTGTSNANITVTGGTSNGCTFSGTAPLEGTQASGTACTLSASFIGSGTGTVYDIISYQPIASTIGSLTLSGTLTGTAIATTTTISGQTPTSPSYAPTATEVSFTVTVAPATGTSAPTGTVSVTVTNTGTSAATSTNYSLTTSGSNGVVTVPLSGLTAGSYTISASYPTSGSFSASSSTTTSFSIAQDTTTTTFTPGVTSISYSSPIGTAILDAAATFGGSAVPGVYVYTANGNEVNAATYLAQGTYTLAVTFYPTDNTDYTSSTASGGTLTVGKASTTAAVGATQNLVASDGTGNFTSVQTAINSLSPTAGGSIYIKPGTYTGFVTVVTPFVSLYGLGGNPANVILTNEDGAFSSPYPTGVGGPAGPGNNGSQGDQGSATMVIARGSISGVNGGNTYTPYNFYGENFTIQNTYDTDTTTTTTNYYNGSTCTVAGTASTLSALYNSGNECNSQALAIWITGDQAVLNNIYTASLQDTIYAGSISASSGYAARQYWFRGKVTGDVDYIFGDAAAVFDHTTIYTTFHGNTATGTETIEAQNKADQTSGAQDYLSGYIMNGNVFTSQAAGMTALYFGRPYGHYSTWIMLNSYIDQVASTGYIEFSGDTNLPTSTYAEYNNHTYTDPSTGSADANGVIYLGTGGSSGSGVTGTRETTSTNPGTVEAASNGFQTKYPALANTTLSQIEAQQYYPLAFLGTTVASNPYNNGVTNWNPTTAIANGANAYATGGNVTTATAGSSVTILIRPQTPGLGAVTNGTYTIPTGTYTLYDAVNGNAAVVIASGTLDASGAAYYTSSSLASGTHSFTWTYSGDSNFSGSTTTTAYALTVSGTAAVASTITLGTPNTPVYGSAATVTATVAGSGSTPTGSATLFVDGTSVQTVALSGGAASFSVANAIITAGTHTLTATYGGSTAFDPSSTTVSKTLTVSKATLTATGVCANRTYDAANVCSAATVTGYQYTDSASTVFTVAPNSTTTATRVSPAASYPAAVGTYTLSTLGSTNYTLNAQNGSFTITGGAPQSIIFPQLPNFPHGATYQLTARTTSGLGVTYSITSGSASISGSIITVNAAGTVTVQASSVTDATGDYAAATPVSVTFTAQ
jgi:hypothetical protein